MGWGVNFDWTQALSFSLTLAGPTFAIGMLSSPLLVASNNAWRKLVESACFWPFSGLKASTQTIEETRLPICSIAPEAGKPPALGAVVPSYKPGVRPADLSDCLPDFAVAAIREALPVFDRQIRGFAMHDAVMTGVETRTSSPIRIPRDDRLQSLNTRGLYPAGEGAGYAGGILSAGVDGTRIAEAVALDIVARSGAPSGDISGEISRYKP